MSTGTLEVIPIDTSDNESMVADTIDDTSTQEDMAQDVHQTTKAAPLEPQVAKVKKEAPQVTIASYHHPHHPTRQHSFRKEGGKLRYYGPRWQ